MLSQPQLFLSFLSFAVFIFWLIPKDFPQFRFRFLLAISVVVVFVFAAPSLLFCAYSSFCAWGFSHWLRKNRSLWVFWLSLIFTLIPLLFFRQVWSAAPLYAHLGVAFFTLKSLSVIMDNYRMKTTSSLEQVLMLNLFFPIYSAGPVEKLTAFKLGHFQSSFHWDSLLRGFFRVSVGLFKATYVSGQLLSVWIKDQWPQMHVDPHQYSVLATYGFVMAKFAFTYINFSGYSDIAVGCGQLFGIKIMENFNFPFLARNIQNFWKRWHISLGNWATAYIFFPVVGLVRNRYAFAYATVLTFFLLGLWHELTWNYAFWGLMHGLGLAAVQLIHYRFKRVDGYKVLAANGFYKLTMWAVTLFYVAWVQTFANLPSFKSGLDLSMRLVGF
jgi:alginate O-acetyltransferase complex protein AlgI